MAFAMPNLRLGSDFGLPAVTADKGTPAAAAASLTAAPRSRA